jgi:hypothetical protein
VISFNTKRYKIDVAIDKNPTIDLDANAYLSRIIFAQNMKRVLAPTLGGNKSAKKLRDQRTNSCSIANVGARLTSCGESTNPTFMFL